MTTVNKEKILALYVEAYKYDNYPPAVGKILGFFFISNQKYFTFEELMEELNLSKSAVSKALKQLMEFGEISTRLAKGSKRKRLFYIDPESFVNRLQAYIDGWHMQNELYKETLKFRNNDNPELNEFIKKFINFNNEALSFIGEKMNNVFAETITKEK